MPRNVPTSLRKRPRQARSEATVSAILEATAQVLVEEGYDRASTNRVAKRAGVSIGSVYQYFPNKEALVGELVDRYSNEITQMVMGYLGGDLDVPPEQMAPRIVQAMIEAKRRDPKLARVLRDQIPRVGRMQLYESHLEAIITAAATYLTHHAERLRVEDPRTAAFVLVHAVDAATHAGVTGDGPSLEALERHVTDLLLSYLVGRQSRVSV